MEISYWAYFLFFERRAISEGIDIWYGRNVCIPLKFICWSGTLNLENAVIFKGKMAVCEKSAQENGELVFKQLISLSYGNRIFGFYLLNQC